MAKLKLPANAYRYYASGSGAQETVAGNRAAFTRLRLLPRMMVDVSNVDTSVSFFGEAVAALLMCFWLITAWRHADVS